METRRYSVSFTTFQTRHGVSFTTTFHALPVETHSCSVSFTTIFHAIPVETRRYGVSFTTTFHAQPVETRRYGVLLYHYVSCPTCGNTQVWRSPLPLRFMPNLWKHAGMAFSLCPTCGNTQVWRSPLPLRFMPNLWKHAGMAFSFTTTFHAQPVETRRYGVLLYHYVSCPTCGNTQVWRSPLPLRFMPNLWKHAGMAFSFTTTFHALPVEE